VHVYWNSAWKPSGALASLLIYKNSSFENHGDEGVGVKATVSVGGTRVISIGNVLITSAVAQSHAKHLNYVERVRGIRNTSTMGTTKKSLAQTHPALAKEAHGWDPELVTAGSGKKLNWKCAIGHTWESTPGHRARGQGCPFCGNRRVLVGFNDLATTHPELAIEADGWDPKEFTAGSHSKKSWKCSLGHTWEVAIEFRSRGGTNCPTCAGKKVESGFNDLASKYPEISTEAFGWDPSTVSASSAKEMRWKCSFGHVYLSRVYSRTGANSTGCSICANREVLSGFNDLATTHPQYALMAHEWDPTQFTGGMAARKKWKCVNGHIYDAAIYVVTSGHGCGICANLVVQEGINDLATTHPELSRLAVGWDPTKTHSGSGKIVEWNCQQGHTFKASILNRAQKGTGCSVCNNKSVQIGFNDLATTHPLLALQANGWDPTTKTAESHDKASWKCEQGHEWTAQINSRSRGRSCPICSNQKTISGINDLKTTHPEIAIQAFGWDPSLVNAGSHVKKDWVCSLGHIWDAAINTRMRGAGQGCPICSNHRLLVGFNDLATTNPELISEVDGWDPTQFLSGARVKKAWVCAEQHRWETSISSRTGTKKSGCPTCAKYGYDINSDGYLYFLEHLDWNMYQIGITNVPDIRLAKHKKKGWKIIELRGPMDGLLTQKWETSILQMLKASGADLSNANVAGKFDGYSEAWSKETCQVKSIKELMSLTERFEGHE